MSRALRYVWATAFVLGVWWLLALVVASPALPGPLQTAEQVVANAATLGPQSAVSLERLLAGLAIGAVLGAPLGLLSGMLPRMDRFVAPVAYILYPVPKIVFLPVLFVFFGLGGQAKVALIALAVFFQMVVTMRDAARAVPKGLTEAMLSLGGNERTVFFHVIVPGTVASFFSALRVSTGTAVAILFIAESMAGSTGLGYFIMHAWSVLEFKQMFAGIIAMALMGVVIYEAFDVAERRLAA